MNVQKLSKVDTFNIEKEINRELSDLVIGVRKRLILSSVFAVLVLVMLGLGFFYPPPFGNLFLVSSGLFILVFLSIIWIAIIMSRKAEQLITS